MPSFQFVCGDSDGPIAGQTKFTAPFLKNYFVDTIIVGNGPENQLTPNPAFVHNYMQGYIDRAPNTWALGDKLVVNVTKCKDL